MINKQFDLNKFYSQSAKMSDFLKGKGHNISRTTLLHGLSVMMGEKNWNTLKPKLKSSVDLIKKENDETYPVIISEKSLFNETLYFIDDYFPMEKLKECISSMFKKEYSRKEYSLHGINEYIIFDNHSIVKDNFALEDISNNLDNPSFIIKYLTLTDDNNKIMNIYPNHLNDFNSFIDSHILNRKLIGDELFFGFSFQFDLNENKRENKEKLLTAILFQHALSSRNTYSSDFFVLHPLVKVNCRGNRVKISIYSFINADYVEQDSTGHFRLPSFFEKSPFMKESYSDYDPNVRMKTLYPQEGFVPNISVSSLNNRELCLKILTKN